MFEYLIDKGRRINKVKLLRVLGDEKYYDQIGLAGIPATVELDEYHLHKGEKFRLTYANEEFENNGIEVIYFKSSATKEIHFTGITIFAKGDIYYREYVNGKSSIDIVSNSGVDLKPKAGNAHELFMDTKTTSISYIRLNPTQTTALSDEFYFLPFPGTLTGVTRTPVIARPSAIIMKADSERVLTFENKSGLETTFGVEFYWTEEEPGGEGG